MTFRINGFHDTMMFGMYFLVALATGQLTARLRLQQAAERQREQRTAALYQLTRELADANDFPEVLSTAIREVGTAFNADVALMLPDPEANQQLVRYPAGMWVLEEKEESVSAWAFHHDQPAGRFTDTLPQAAGLHLPLSAGGKPKGVMAVRFHSGKSLGVQQRSLLESFVRQIALVIDRQRLRDAEINAKLLAESEQLSRTLLNSVSHELRTPISAITSATSALTEAGPLNPAQRELATEIETASTRLNRVVQNLLGAARLQSGHLILTVADRGPGLSAPELVVCHARDHSLRSRCSSREGRCLGQRRRRLRDQTVPHRGTAGQNARSLAPRARAG